MAGRMSRRRSKRRFMNVRKKDVQVSCDREDNWFKRNGVLYMSVATTERTGKREKSSWGSNFRSNKKKNVISQTALVDSFSIKQQTAASKTNC